jgi:hypothetical protein
VSAHVRRDGPHQITVEDGHGNGVRFVTTAHRLGIELLTADSPQLTAGDALDLAAELGQWATTQMSRRCA